MADERIPGLPDLVGDETTWSFIMDKTGETSAAKVPFIIGMQTIQSQITDNADAIDLKADKTNVLEKNNVTSYTPSADYHPSTYKWTNEGGLRIAQATATKNSAVVNDSSTDCQVVYMSGMHHVSGTLSFSTNPGVDTTVFTIPVQFPVFAIDWYIPVMDANVDEGNELKCVAGTRTIVNFSSAASQTSQGVFSANIPAFITGT